MGCLCYTEITCAYRFHFKTGLIRFCLFDPVICTTQRKVTHLTQISELTQSSFNPGRYHVHIRTYILSACVITYVDRQITSKSSKFSYKHVHITIVYHTA